MHHQRGQPIVKPPTSIPVTMCLVEPPNKAAEVKPPIIVVAKTWSIKLGLRLVSSWWRKNSRIKL